MKETAVSLSARLGEGAWDAELASELFTVIAACGHCDDPTIVSGVTVPAWMPEDDPHGSWCTYLTPKYVYPPPVIVRRPKGIPATLDGAVIRAEGLFWTDVVSGVGAVRDVVEDILACGSIGVPASAEQWLLDTRDRRELTLHHLLKGFTLLEELLELAYE